MSKDLILRNQKAVVSFNEAYSMAEVFYKSKLFDDVQDEAQALVKILKGQELGLPPVAAMGAFDVIQKKLYVKGQTCVALINACPYAGFTPIESTAESCTIVFHRRYPEGWKDLPAVEYTIEEAKARGLVTRSPEWKTAPANMLYWRCMTRGTARYFSELIMGVAVPEDIEAPVSETRAQRNIADLWGDEVDTDTGEITHQEEREAYFSPQSDPEPTPEEENATQGNLDSDEGTIEDDVPEPDMPAVSQDEYRDKCKANGIPPKALWYMAVDMQRGPMSLPEGVITWDNAPEELRRHALTLLDEPGWCIAMLKNMKQPAKGATK